MARPALRNVSQTLTWGTIDAKITHMYPEPLFYILNVPAYLYDILQIVGLILALAMAVALAREHGGIPLKDVFIVWLACAIAQLALTPVLVLLVEQLGFDIPLNWSFMRIVAVFIALAIAQVTFHKTPLVPLSHALDIAAPPVMVFLAFARLACLAAGCCFGAPAPGLPWAITFTNPNSLALHLNVPVHPTQLYEMFGALAILGIVLGLRHRAMWRGNLMWVTLLLYAALRFIIEFYRGDIRAMVGLLSLNQVVCIAFAVVCGAILARSLLRFPMRRGVEATF